MGGSTGNSISNAFEDTWNFVTADTRRGEGGAQVKRQQDEARWASENASREYDAKATTRAKLFATGGGAQGVLAKANTSRKQFLGQ